VTAAAGPPRFRDPGSIEYADASAEVRAVYDEIMAVRKSDWVNNYWKVLAHHRRRCGACGPIPKR